MSDLRSKAEVVCSHNADAKQIKALHSNVRAKDTARGTGKRDQLYIKIYLTGEKKRESGNAIQI